MQQLHGIDGDCRGDRPAEVDGVQHDRQPTPEWRVALAHAFVRVISMNVHVNRKFDLVAGVIRCSAAIRIGTLVGVF
jgi:hypothetical protein